MVYLNEIGFLYKYLYDVVIYYVFVCLAVIYDGACYYYLKLIVD